jgi:hypothetical protein
MDIIKKSDAKLLGLTYYFTGNSCCRGHTSPRRVDNGNCVECGKISSKQYNKKHEQSITLYQQQYRASNKEHAAEYDKQYRCNNKERIALYWKQYHKDNKERMLQYYKHRSANNQKYIQWMKEYRKKYYLTNKDSILTNSRQYRIANPDKVANHTSNRRSSKLQATPIWYETDKIATLYSKAQYWSNMLYCNIQVDHIIPLISDTVCGLHCFDNLQLLERSLNCSKGNNYQSDW